VCVCVWTTCPKSLYWVVKLEVERALYVSFLHWSAAYEGLLLMTNQQRLNTESIHKLTTDIHLVSKYGRRPLRSSTDRTLTVPWTHNRFGDRSFAVAGPRLWNSLLISLRQTSSYGQFRRYLKNHLFGIWEITAQWDAWFSALYKYSYLLTYLLINSKEGEQLKLYHSSPGVVCKICLSKCFCPHLSSMWPCQTDLKIYSVHLRP